MTAPAQSRRSSNGGRAYVWPPAPAPTELYVPSVTTILKQVAKQDVLVPWAAKQVAEFAVEHILSWQDLPRDAAIDLLKRQAHRTNLTARELGSAVHAAIDAHLGGVPTIDPHVAPFVAAAVQFLEDHVEEVQQHESTIYNRTYQYAGTFDLLALTVLRDGRTALIDWKSGSDIYPDVALQLIAYARAEFIGTDDGEEKPMPTIDIAIAVHLRSNGTYVAKEIELTERDWRAFVACRSLHAWEEHRKANVFGKVHKGSTKSVEEQEPRRF